MGSGEEEEEGEDIQVERIWINERDLWNINEGESRR